MEHSNGDRLKTALLLVALGVVPVLAALLPAATGHQPTLLQGNQT